MTLLTFTFPTQEDDRIHDDVCRQIVWQPEIQSREINVEVRNAEVFLSGEVETCLERLEAERAAKAVYGVVSVTNNIEVVPKTQRADDEIACDVIAGLRTIASVLDKEPKVSVRSGIVMLEGKLHWNFQRQSAERVAQAVVGVRQVLNFIEVAPFTLPAPCRQPIQRRPDTTPSAPGRKEPAACKRPLFFVPSVVGRA